MRLWVYLSKDDDSGTWSLRVSPWPTAVPIAGLDDSGAATHVRFADLEDLDGRMLVARAGYNRRLDARGTIELSASGRGAEVLCRWVSDVVAASRRAPARRP